LRKVIKQIILPPLVLVGLDLFAASVFFGQAQTVWLFKNTKNWVQVASVLTFTEAVLCFIIAAGAGMGRSEHSTLVTQAQEVVPLDTKQYEKQREQSLSQALRLGATGVVLIILTLILQLLPQ
jgi:hypothetical protein